MDKICESDKLKLSREKVKEAMHLIYEHGSQTCRYLLIGDEKDEQRMRIGFMLEDLEASKNPALNN